MTTGSDERRLRSRAAVKDDGRVPHHVRVSVIVPTYNRADLLRRALDSVVAQGEPSLQLIVVDDRSTDQTSEVVREFRAKHPDVCYLLNTRKQGPAGARNHGLDVATGQFVAFLDSDDVWAPDHLLPTLSQMEAHPHVDWIQGDLERVKDDEVVTRSYFAEMTPSVLAHRSTRFGSLRLLDPAGLIEQALDRPWPCYVQASVFRRRVFDRQRFSEELFGVEDYDFLLRFLAGDGVIALDERIHVRYFLHSSNISNAANDGADAVKNIERATEMRKLWLGAAVDPLFSGKVRARIRRRLADLHLWHFAYHGYFKMRRPLRGTAHAIAALRYGYDRPALWYAVTRLPLGYLLDRVAERIGSRRISLTKH